MIFLKKKFKLFDMTKPGKGISKQQVLKEESTDIFGYFRMFKNRFWNISSLNMIYVLVNFPLFFGLISLSGAFRIETTTPASIFYPNLLGMTQYGITPYLSTLIPVLNMDTTISVPTLTSNIFAWLTLLLVFTNGISNIGASYVLRGYIRSEPVFILSDFFGAIKKNFRQGFILGILDFIFLFMLGYGTYLYFLNSYYFGISVMLCAELFIFIIYLTMRFYMYLLAITFDLSIVKIIKNSFIFAMVGFKMNFFSWLGVAAIIFVNLFVFISIPVFGVILPFILTFSTLMFTTAFNSYQVIKKYMITPYYKDETNEKITPVDDPIFIDRG